MCVYMRACVCVSSTPDEDHVSKVLVFLIVMCLRIGEYISLELFRSVSLTSCCSLIPLLPLCKVAVSTSVLEWHRASCYPIVKYNRTG